MATKLENQKIIENLRMEILNHKSVQKGLTQDREKILHAAILDHKLGLDFLEYDCECIKGKEKK